MNSNTFFTPSFYVGICEDRQDPLMLGRIRVRIVGLHTHDKALLPTEDLPWAYRIQGTTGSAMNGIGNAPVGIVEGSTVVVQFIDNDLQQPFVVGVLGGIPSKNRSAFETYTITSSTTSTENTTQNQQQVEVPSTEDVQNSFQVRAPSEFSASADIINYIKKAEGFRSVPYRDSAGVWTIGYGTTFIGGVAVSATTPPITEAQATTYLTSKLKTEFEPGIKSAIRVPITQSMFDACVSLSYNIGTGAFRRSTVCSEINTKNFESAASSFTLFNKAINAKTGALEVLPGLVFRREYERDLFLRDGIPTETGELAPTPQSIQATTTTTNISQETTEGISRNFFTGDAGFNDPNGKYPLSSFLEEPDTNRLARNQKIRYTSVYAKEISEHKDVPLANNKGSWNQSPTPYNATYPFNNVWQSESGHIFEFDDTQGTERINLYHRKGTFLEIDHNGTQVNKVIGDSYQIYERNGYVHVIGNVNVTVDGAKTLRVENTLDLEVHGATTINLHNNAKLNVAGDFDISAGGNIRMHAGGNININASGNYAVDATRIDNNSGIATSLNTIETKTTEAVSISPLTVRTRKEEAATSFESPEDGTPEELAQYKNSRIENATITKEELESQPSIEEVKEVEENTVEEILNECGVFEGQTNFPTSTKLSKYFTLADLTKGGTVKLKNNVGLRADEIFCNLKALCENVLDPIKEAYPDMRINSGLRQEQNKSQHNKGQAVDISFPSLSRADLYERALKLQQLVAHDQMLLEYANPGGNGWIHISFSKGNNRKQVFTMVNHERVGKIGTFTKIT